MTRREKMQLKPETIATQVNHLLLKLKVAFRGGGNPHLDCFALPRLIAKKGLNWLLQNHRYLQVSVMCRLG